MSFKTYAKATIPYSASTTSTKQEDLDKVYGKFYVGQSVLIHSNILPGRIFHGVVTERNPRYTDRLFTHSLEANAALDRPVNFIGWSYIRNLRHAD